MTPKKQWEEIREGCPGYCMPPEMLVKPWCSILGVYDDRMACLYENCPFVYWSQWVQLVRYKDV